MGSRKCVRLSTPRWLTGGGFGGSVVMLVRAGEGAPAALRIAGAYEARSGRRATVLVPPRATASGDQ